MARPRIFISSTYYDLKHLRASLENFVESLGYEAILSEKGDIAYSPDIPLDESCYREIRSADIFVFIIGGRYGSEKSSSKSNSSKSFYDRYESITKEEYLTAIKEDIPIYILIEKSVYADFETYLKNKEKKDINYAHADSVNIFNLINYILSQPRNNPAHYFDKYSEIEDWLREQWAGLFRDLIKRMSNQRQLSSLSIQVNELSEINKTLKTYLEEIVTKIIPKESKKLINKETQRLGKISRIGELNKYSLITELYQFWGIPIEEIYKGLISNRNSKDFMLSMIKLSGEKYISNAKELDKFDWPMINMQLRNICKELLIPEFNYYTPIIKKSKQKSVKI